MRSTPGSLNSSVGLWMRFSRSVSIYSARGRATKRMPTATTPAYRAAQQAHSLIWGLGISADILVWSREEFEQRVHVKTSLPAVVLREGTLLHAA